MHKVKPQTQTQKHEHKLSFGIRLRNAGAATIYSMFIHMHYYFVVIILFYYYSSVQTDHSIITDNAFKCVFHFFTIIIILLLS